VMQMGAGSPKRASPHGCPGCDGATPYFPGVRAVIHPAALRAISFIDPLIDRVDHCRT
jgi:hypothetical protein